jgi:hypothetical protein
LIQSGERHERHPANRKGTGAFSGPAGIGIGRAAGAHGWAGNRISALANP